MRQLKITQQITNRSGKSMEAYLREVAKEPMINAEEEVRLAKLIRDGDEKALERLVRSNLRFVISVAKQYQNHGLALEDLINEGNIGLIEAAKRFDETKGFKFISYAVWWIRQSITKAIGEKTRKIRIPANQAKIARDIAKATLKIEQENERKATDDEIATMLNMDSGDIRKLLMLSSRQLSIDAPLSTDDGSSSLGETLADTNVLQPSDNLLSQSLTTEIETILSNMDKKEAEVIRLSFGLTGVYPLSVAAIGVKLELSRERVRQLKNRGLRKLYQSASLRQLRDYL